MKSKGFKLTDEGMIFPVGVPTDSIAFEYCTDQNVLESHAQLVEDLREDIEYVSEYLDYDSEILSFANVRFEKSKMIIQVIKSKYSIFRGALAKLRRDKEVMIPFLPWALPNALGISVSVITSDSYVLWEFRSPNRFVRSGQVDCAVVSCLVPPDDNTTSFPIRFLNTAILNSFEEEVCPLPEGTLVDILVDGLYFDEGYGQWEILARMSVPFDRDYIELHYKDRLDPEEVNRLEFMPLNSPARTMAFTTGELYGRNVIKEISLTSAMANSKTWNTSLKAKDIVKQRKAPPKIKPKMLFSFDADCTLTEPPIGAGEIFKPARETIQALREAGHDIMVASGRNFAGANWIAHSINTRNIVYFGGQGIYIQDKVDELTPLDKDACLHLLMECTAAGLPWAVCLDRKQIRITPYADFNRASDREFETTELVTNLDLEGDDINIYAIHIMCTRQETHQLKMLSALPSYRQDKTMLYVESINKEVGIRRIARELGHEDDTVVVFGSGYNDITALKGPWTSIAPANGVDDALRACDFITDSTGLRGLEHACQFFGWLPRK